MTREALGLAYRALKFGTDADLAIDAVHAALMSPSLEPRAFWQPIDTCPAGERVVLLNRAGFATVGVAIGSLIHNWWVAWSPLPKMTPEIKAQLT